MLGDDLFRVSFASDADLEELSKIHAQVSMASPLGCCTFAQLTNDFDSHLEGGRFDYGQAFAAKSDAFVLKVTIQTSGDIVGCAWLQLQAFPNECYTKLPLCQPGFTPPDSFHPFFYPYIHRLRHQQRRLTFRSLGTDINPLPHYCEYRYLSNSHLNPWTCY